MSCYLAEPKAVELLGSYGIDYPESKMAKSCSEAVEIAENIGYPVVLKIVSPVIVHKSDVGGVKVNINTKEQLIYNYREMVSHIVKDNPECNIEGVFVCKQVDEALELIIGSTVDDIFGKVIMFGLGGIFTEVLKDVTFRVCPINKEEALEMVKEIRGYEILKGVRGKQTLDIESLCDLLVKVSNLVYEKDEIKELDLNPVRLFSDKVIVLDARIITGRNL